VKNSSALVCCWCGMDGFDLAALPRPKAASPTLTPTSASGGTINHFPRPSSTGSLGSTRDRCRDNSGITPCCVGIIDHFPRPSSKGSSSSTGTLVLSTRSFTKRSNGEAGQLVRSNSDLSTSASSASTLVRPYTPCGPRPAFGPKLFLPASANGTNHSPAATAVTSAGLSAELKEELVERPETRLQRMTRYAARPLTRTQERRRPFIKDLQVVRPFAGEEDAKDEKDGLSGWSMVRFKNMASQLAREAGPASPPLGRSASESGLHAGALHCCEAASWGWGVRPLSRTRTRRDTFPRQR